MSRWKVCMTKVTTSAVASIMFNLRKSHTQSTDDTMPKVSFKCLSIPFLPLISAQWGEIIFEGELEIFSYASGLLGLVWKILVVRSGPEGPQFARSVGILQYGTATYASLKFQQKGCRTHLN